MNPWTAPHRPVRGQSLDHAHVGATLTDSKIRKYILMGRYGTVAKARLEQAMREKKLKTKPTKEKLAALLDELGV